MAPPWPRSWSSASLHQINPKLLDKFDTFVKQQPSKGESVPNIDLYCV